MKLGHKLVLRVLENELQRLEKKWLKAKQESDLCKLIKKDPNKIFEAEIIAENELYEFKQELSHIKMRYERGGL